MHFVIDAQLPPRLVPFFANRGHDAVHVQDLPGGVTASDADIATYADAEGAVVITKDADFRHAHIATGRPHVRCCSSRPATFRTLTLSPCSTRVLMRWLPRSQGAISWRSDVNSSWFTADADRRRNVVEFCFNI
jgi:predicted nuclease of predicted toxin-antitoxin system